MSEITNPTKEASREISAYQRKNFYPWIESEIVDQIKQVPIASLFEQELGITRHKNTYRCCFHDDHRPSLSVSPTKNLFYCHACGVGGDAITFVQKRYDLRFYDAVAFLADRIGISYQRSFSPLEINRLKQKAQERKERVAELDDLEQLHKAVENDLYDCLRRSRYRLPHHRRDIVFFNPKIYSASLIKEEELDRTFDELDQAVADRKKYFQEARNATYRN
ncbi:MAG: hypothetical protein HYZ85_04245 [Candidatus Omnitrophica bacterium]|nr:hypothetical protein [Candidatus Omnitrophota bacterium]